MYGVRAAVGMAELEGIPVGAADMDAAQRWQEAGRSHLMIVLADHVGAHRRGDHIVVCLHDRARMLEHLLGPSREQISDGFFAHCARVCRPHWQAVTIPDRDRRHCLLVVVAKQVARVVGSNVLRWISVLISDYRNAIYCIPHWTLWNCQVSRMALGSSTCCWRCMVRLPQHA
jgi:hypothetical protein